MVLFVFWTKTIWKHVVSLSDIDILDELDNILAKEESDDESLDDLCFDDDDSGNYS